MSHPDHVQDWVALVDGRYPEADVADWDATGLQVGDSADPVDAVLVCLDVTPATIREATGAGASLIVAHHPLLFRPLTRLTAASAPGRLALRAARSGVAVLAAHTNLDVAEPGTSEPIVAALGLTDVGPLSPAGGEADELKLVTFVPEQDTIRVLEAVSAAGAGRIGEYDQCSFRVAGTGTFRPSDAARPAVGERGRRNEVREDRLETLVRSDRLRQVIDALTAAHPYEEVAFDVYPLRSQAGDAVGAKGLGRVGDLPAPLTLGALADRLATALPSPGLRVAGDLDRPVRRVAACGGAGDGLIEAALAAGADTYVTGDLRHHVALDALTMGLTLVDAGHYATEAAALPRFRAELEAAARGRGLRARVLASAVRTDPWSAYRPPA